MSETAFETEPPSWLLGPRKYGTCSSWNYPQILNYKVLVGKLAPTQEGQGGTKQANDSRSIGGRFNEQGNSPDSCGSVGWAWSRRLLGSIPGQVPG